MNKYVISADVMLCLMMIQENGDYIPSEPMSYDYFFLVPETFTTDLTENSRQLMNQIYQEHYQTFKIREPNDLNYIAVVGVTPVVLASAEIASSPWLTGKTPMWESSGCVVASDSAFQKVAPNTFSEVVASSL